MKGRDRKVIVRGDAGRIVCERCELAGGPVSRARGLLGRSGLAPGEGLLLRPAFSVHTFFMRFAIDIVFLDRSGEVVAVAEAVRPWRAATRFRARAVLELAAGEAARLKLGPGERLEPEAVAG